MIFMLRLLKRISWVALLAAGAQTSFGFALLGPFNELYQVREIFYQVPGDIGGPKNIGEEYRRNTPVLYYSFDANFLDYFGARGVEAIEQAIAVYNDLAPVSQYSAELNEFPLEASRQNYEAEALSLTDLKSTTMNMLIEQLGLAEPDRYTW